MSAVSKEDAAEVLKNYEQVLRLRSELQVAVAGLDAEVLRLRQESGVSPGHTLNFDTLQWVPIPQRQE